MIVAILCAAFATSPSPAAPLIASTASCTGYAVPGATTPSSCTATMNIIDDRRVALLETHANFHNVEAAGRLTLTWFDPNDKVVAAFECNAVGGYITVGNPTGGSSVQIGAADATHAAACKETASQAATYAKGLQRVVVTASAQSCNTGGRETRCTFHGLIAFNPRSLPA